MVQDGEVPNYAIGRAIGAVFYIEPFATQDVDVFVMMETESTGLVTRIPGWDYLKERGYSEIRGEAIVVEDWPVQFIPVIAMSDEKPNKNYPDPTELYRKKEAQRKTEARRPVSEKMAAVVRLRDLERSLESVRHANKERRAAKQITIGIKTR